MHNSMYFTIMQLSVSAVLFTLLTDCVTVTENCNVTLLVSTGNTNSTTLTITHSHLLNSFKNKYPVNKQTFCQSIFESQQFQVMIHLKEIA